MTIVLIWLIAVFALIYFNHSLTKKKTKNERTPPHKKKPQLLRFQRGNKTLTPDQQKELETISQQNYRALLNRWKHEHL